MASALSASMVFAHGIGPAGQAGASAAACRAWKMVPSPVVENAGLGGVSGTSSTDVWAVGSYLDQSGSIIEHWDGTAWTLIPHPASTLYGVTAISQDDVWAVGGLGVIQHWDGVAWKTVPSPKPGSFRSLFGVSATSSTDVWAGGYYTAFDGRLHPLALHWGGVRWTLVHVPDGSPYGTNAFRAITAISPDDAWGVGYQDVSGGFNLQPLAEHWDGTAWTPVEVPPIPTGYTNELYGVDGSSSTDVWAVGIYAADRAFPLVEHWDGTVWTQIDMSLLLDSNELFGVAALSSGDAWAVGKSFKTGPAKPFTQYWDGTAWTVPASPNPGNASLFSVAIISPTNIWAVGSDFDEGLVKPVPLIMRSRGPC